MGPVHAETVIDSPRERVFEYLCDLGNRAAIFEQGAEQVRLLRVDPVGLGAGVRLRLLTRPAGTWMDSTIVKVEPPFRISERGRTGRLNRDLTATEWELTEQPGQVCTVRVTFWTEPASPAAAALEKLHGSPRWHRRHLNRGLGRLRQLVEGGEPRVERVRVAGGNRYATGIP